MPISAGADPIDAALSARATSSGNAGFNPDPNVSRQSDKPIESGGPVSTLLGSYNDWAGKQLESEARLFGVSDAKSLQYVRSIPSATETVLGASAGDGRPSNEPFGSPATSAPQVHPLQEAANAVQSDIDATKAQASAQGFELSDKAPSVPQQISNRLSREQLNLPKDSPLYPDMLHAANKAYVSPAFEAVKSWPQPIKLSDYTKATLEDVKPLMPANEVKALPSGDEITAQQGVDASIALRAKAKQFPDYGVNANNQSWESVAKAHVDAARAIEGDIRTNLSSNGQESLADDWDNARVYRAISGAYEDALDGAGNVRVPELKKQLLRQGVPLTGNAAMLAKIGAAYPEMFKATPAAPQVGIVKKAVASTLPAVLGAAGAHVGGPFGAALGVGAGESLGNKVLRP
jgi:hypothetical protein